MTSKVNIIFADNPLIKSNYNLKQFIVYGQRNLDMIFINGNLHVIIKEIKEKDENNLDKVRMIAGEISRELSNRKIESASIDEEEFFGKFNKITKDSLITAFVEGWILGGYKYTKYKSNEKEFTTKLTFVNNNKFESSIQLGRMRAGATNFSRDLLNEIPSSLNPESFPMILKNEFDNTDVQVSVFDEKQLREMGMNGVLSVGKGSVYKPSFVELKYEGDSSKPLIVFVGKGVTFDTGGISLKTARNLSNMRMDMGGASAVAGAIKLLDAVKAKVNIIGLIPIVENMPDNKSLLPGEVITYNNGLTVQVGNTDAEGRLILADGLIRAGELKPEYIVDVATLTGSVVNALGPKFAGVFGDEKLTHNLKEIGKMNGDNVWPLPLVEEYGDSLKSDYADFSNISSQNEAGSITAALFLQRFVPKQCKWIHIDMAGQMTGEEVGYYGKTATGYGVRLLADYAENVSSKFIL